MRKGKRFFKTFVLAAAFCAMSAVTCTCKKKKKKACGKKKNKNNNKQKQQKKYVEWQYYRNQRL